MINLGAAVTFQVDDEDKRRYGRINTISTRENGYFTVFKIRCNDGREFEIHEITHIPVGVERNVRAAQNSLHFIMMD